MFDLLGHIIYGVIAFRAHKNISKEIKKNIFSCLSDEFAVGNSGSTLVIHNYILSLLLLAALLY